jgi:hypothetical protein
MEGEQAARQKSLPTIRKPQPARHWLSKLLFG